MVWTMLAMLASILPPQPMRFKAATLRAVVVASVFSLAPDSFGQLLFQDNFDAGTSGPNWTVNKGGGTDSNAFFAFDYNSLGIPSAPNSTGGSTIGLKFNANPTAGVVQGISASPTGLHFTGDLDRKSTRLN